MSDCMQFTSFVSCSISLSHTHTQSPMVTTMRAVDTCVFLHVSYFFLVDVILCIISVAIPFGIPFELSRLPLVPRTGRISQYHRIIATTKQDLGYVSIIYDWCTEDQQTTIRNSFCFTLSFSHCLVYRRAMKNVAIVIILFNEHSRWFNWTECDTSSDQPNCQLNDS